MIFTLFHYYYWNNFDEKPYTADLATVKMKLEIGATIVKYLLSQIINLFSHKKY